MGHRRRAVPVRLLIVSALLFIAAVAGVAGVSRLLPGGVTAWGRREAGGSVTRRPIITTKLPASFLAPRVHAMSSGPQPDPNLTANTPASNEVDPCAWNNGTTDRIAFASNGVALPNNGGIGPTIPPGVTPNYNLWIMRPDGSEQVQISDIPGDSREPAYDASGNLFAFANNQTGIYQIYTIQIASGIVQQITTGPGNKRHPTWSPDENYIAFQSDAGGKEDIYKILSNGAGTPIRLSSGAGNNTAPSWKPQANIIAYTGQVGAVTRIFTVDDQGNNTTVISNGGGDATANDQQPAWQADGSTLVFASDRFTSPTDKIHNFNIWRMGATGEVTGASATLTADASPSDTFNNTYPTISTSMTRQEMRVVYQSDKTAATHDEFDLYARIVQDIFPPKLLAIPTVDNRQPAPGAAIKVSVPVFDDNSGVKSVTAFFKDPDAKIWEINPLGSPASFDGGGVETGQQYLEIGARTVGSVALTDPTHSGTFTGVWTTLSAPHDYIIDIEATDNAGNTLRYDDIYGFSTRVFTPIHNILFVDDYCEGQAYLAATGSNNDYPAGFPVESYYRYNPSDLVPPAFNTDHDSIAGGFGLGYDVWRVICRGRIPQSVYQIYKPTVEYQLDPTDAVSNPATAKPTRKVQVSEHMILWAAPHTGDVWVPENSGSLVDPTVQADLTNYLNSGGKLFLTGQDIAWALTQNGLVGNTFLNTMLHASFVADVPDNALGYSYSWFVGSFGGTSRMQNTAYGVTMASPAGDPVTGATWSPEVDADDAPVDLETPRYGYVNTCPPAAKEDAAWWSLYPDQIQVQAPAIKIYGYGTPGNFNPAGPDAGLRYQDPTSGAQLVYLAFGLEEVHRGYDAPAGVPLHCANHRSHLITNAYIWMTTGTFQGRVVGIDGKPLHNPNPIVRALQGGVVQYAVRCQDDGTYVMNGVAPGTYAMESFRPGYDIDHFDADTTNAALGPVVVDFVLSQSPPGAVAGVVTAAATGNFISNIPVTVYNAVASTTTPTTYTKGTIFKVVGNPTNTAADGTYSVGGLPAGEYIVEANTVGAPGYQSGYNTPDTPAAVTSGNSTTVNFALTAAPGSLTVTVLKKVAGPPATTAPLAGATVTVTAAGATVATGVTDTNGHATLSLAAGSYTVTASAPGYGVSAGQGATVVSAQTATLSITLTPQPPGSLSGTLVSATTGAPIGGIMVHLQVNGTDVVPPVQSQSTLTTEAGGQTYNYIFTDAPTGQVNVVPVAPGFTIQPPTQSATVVSGQETAGIDFVLSSLHTFPSGLSMISTPYDYPYALVNGMDVNDPHSLLGQGTNPLLMAAWMPLVNRYALYPNAPADHFRLGQGYWLDLPANADLTRNGTPAGDPYPVKIQTGWNMIGDPFTQAIDFTTVQVDDQNGIYYTLAQAVSANPPLLDSTLFAYVLGGYQMLSTLDPWVGDWLHAYQPVTVWISAATGGLAVGATPAGVSAMQARWGLAAPSGGWYLPLTASAGRCVDESAVVGVSPQGSASYNRQTDVLKPPAASFQPFVYAALVKDGAPGPLAVDLLAPATQLSWTVVVRTNQQGRPVNLAWPDLSLLPNNVRPVLEDLATGQRVYMRTTSGYRFTAQEAERQFRITVTTGTPGTLVVSALSAAPGTGRVSLCYTLGQEAAVTVEIRNISGVLIRRLVSGLAQGAGIQTLAWNGRSDSGAAVPNGQYLITLNAVTPEGQASQAITSVWLGR